jgi:hypothetical protein
LETVEEFTLTLYSSLLFDLLLSGQSSSGSKRT